MAATPLSPETALRIVLENIEPKPSETLAHAQILNRTLARDVSAPFDLPPFDNSAMDGYAVVSHSLRAPNARLRLVETIGAGDVASHTVSSENCVKIMTGAPIPAGADAVVMREETALDGTFVTFENSAKTGQNIRQRGSDVRAGETVLRAGTPIRAAQWAMLASLGLDEIEVFQTPKIGVLMTGAELVSPGQPLCDGQIYDSNSFALRGLASATGAQIVTTRRCGDSPDEVLKHLREMAEMCDLIVTSGGVSAGDFDPVRDVLHQHAQVHFWKIAMKPGKPVLFASFNQTPVFGLPGNPVSVMVAFEEFVRPAILKQSGRQFLHRPTVQATLEHDLKRSPGRTELMRAQLRFQNGIFVADVRGDQGSGRLSTMTSANALLLIAPEIATLNAGGKVQARLLDAPEDH